MGNVENNINAAKQLAEKIIRNVETVMVGNRQATFARGSMADSIYDPEGSLYLVWDTVELSIKLIYTAPTGYPTRLDQAGMIAIAESME